MVGVFRLKPDARTVVQPEPTALGLLGWKFQPSRGISAHTNARQGMLACPRGPFDVHDPACLVQHRSGAAIAISAILWYVEKHGRAR